MGNLLFRIDQVKANTAESKTFYLDAGHTVFNYKPGQFLTLILKFAGEEVRRSYSLSSTPGIDHLPFITIKRVENGQASRYLFDHLQEGDIVESLPASGRFLLDTYNTHHFFIAAGSGITPVFALLKQALYHTEDALVTLLYQNTNEGTSIFRNELQALQQAFPERFQLLELFSQPYEAMHHSKRLNNSLLATIAQQYAARLPVHFYLCGPKDFMRMALFTLRTSGYAESNISKENFVVDVVPPPPFTIDPTPRNVRIRFKEKDYQLKVAWPTNILQAALDNDIRLPYSCRGGRCSTCVAACEQGSVKMSINEVLTDKDIEEGLVLTCVGYATSDVTLNFDNIE